MINTEMRHHRTSFRVSHLSHFALTKERYLVAGKRPQKPLEYHHWSSTRH